MSNYKYKEGQRYGPYKVLFLERLPNARGIFQCPFCNNTFEAQTNKVGSGNTTRCKECTKKRRSELGKSKIIDITGKRFGKLVVLERVTNKGWKCQCDCGTIIITQTSNLTTGHTLSCGCIKSKGEEKISQILNKYNIIFKKEKTFNDCINSDTNNKLRFDFYLPDYNCCIEYDGEQHFNTPKGWWTYYSLQDRQKLDNLKNQYCLKKGIYLVRIPYWEYDNIENIIKNTITGDFNA